MGKKRKRKKKKDTQGRFALSTETKQWIWGIVLIGGAAIVSLSFFERAGVAGRLFMRSARFLVGDTIFLIPLVFVIGGLIFFRGRRDKDDKARSVFWPVLLAIVLLVAGVAGILGTANGTLERGGMIGYSLSWPLVRYFEVWVSYIIFAAIVVVGLFVVQQFLFRWTSRPKESRPEEQVVSGAAPEGAVVERPKQSLIKKIFAPKFKVKEISPVAKESKEAAPETALLKPETKAATGSGTGATVFSYQPPSLELLEKDHGAPTSGDTRTNSAIIKKTLQNFGIDVAMSEINIGPTVTQYTLKPAEGVKLSKITTLSNDLALALAAHPLRIEAPIPGRSLVGVEVPNKVRAEVRLRNMLEHEAFQKSSGNLLIALGRDVSGTSVYADLTRMPHMLVAGSTGTGKTIFLNSLVQSLLYQPSTATKSAGPETLRLILVDPKRVEFPVYSKLPHLLCPVIYSASQTVNALRWLTGEMERRFDVLSEAGVRDIRGFNEKALKNGSAPLPFIVLIIDELADLMAAKGREIEAGIVRLAQMSRAVGIHLVVATQRPSVEVITGLIKANITSRITFQVASQIDSRTILDMAGAERLLGAGDMLYLSTETIKPKRLQGPYVSEKEVKRVVKDIESRREALDAEMDDGLLQELDRHLEEGEGGSAGAGYEDNDPLYEEAKRVVIESDRASSSLLQRRLRVGYARAARLIDILEDKGVIGPGEGAKPREVYGDVDGEKDAVPKEDAGAEGENDEEWKKV